MVLPPGLSESERKLWTQSASEADHLAHSGLIYAEEPLAGYVQGLGDRLLPATDVPATFRFHVVLDPEANAFALPDGNIYVHLGLLAQLQREAQLAAVLAHETAHVTGRHTLERYDQAQGVSAVTQVLGLAAAIGFGAAGGSWAGLFNNASQLGLALTAGAAINGHSRAAEAGADRFAVEALAAHEYDPCGAADLFTVLLGDEDEPSAAASFFWGSHPRLSSRRAAAEEEVEALTGASCDGIAVEDTAFVERMAAARALQVELWVRAERYDRAAASARRAMELRPDDPALHFWNAEALSLAGTDPETLDEAEAGYRRASELDPTFAAPFRGLGALAERRGDPDAAAAAYERYLALDPDAKDRRYVRHRIEELTAAE